MKYRPRLRDPETEKEEKVQGLCGFVLSNATTTGSAPPAEQLAGVRPFESRNFLSLAGGRISHFVNLYSL